MNHEHDDELTDMERLAKRALGQLREEPTQQAMNQTAQSWWPPSPVAAPTLRYTSYDSPNPTFPYVLSDEDIIFLRVQGIKAEQEFQ